MQYDLCRATQQAKIERDEKFEKEADKEEAKDEEVTHGKKVNPLPLRHFYPLSF